MRSKDLCCINYKHKCDPKINAEKGYLCTLYHGMQTYIDTFDLKRSVIEHKMKLYELLTKCLNEAAGMLEKEETPV